MASGLALVRTAVDSASESVVWLQGFALLVSADGLWVTVAYAHWMYALPYVVLILAVAWRELDPTGITLPLCLALAIGAYCSRYACLY